MCNIIKIMVNYINHFSLIISLDLTDKMKRSFFQAVVVSIMQYGCTTWTLTKRLEKKLDGNYTRMLRAILNKSWQQHSTRHQLYGHLPPITKTIKVRRTRHAGHCWRSRDKLISDVLLWTPTYGRAKAGRPARTYILQLCEDTGCSPEDLPEAMNDWKKWRERITDIRASGTTLWWWFTLVRLWTFQCLQFRCYRKTGHPHVCAERIWQSSSVIINPQTGNGARRPLGVIEWVDDVVPERDGLGNFRIFEKKDELRFDRWRKRLSFSDLMRSDQFGFRLTEMSWDLRHYKMCRVLRRRQHNIVSLDFYDLCLSFCVANDWT